MNSHSALLVSHQDLDKYIGERPSVILPNGIDLISIIKVADNVIPFISASD